jgi:hypothetical protein
MKFFFPSPDTDKTISVIQKTLAGRKLGQMVSIDHVNAVIEVTISKLGTSIIQFSKKQRDGGEEWALKSEKIAFAHKAFKSEVLEKLFKIVESAGGQVL